MAAPNPEQFFESFDGAAAGLARAGRGRPVVLLHGYFSNAEVNWMKLRPCRSRSPTAGFRVIMPDLRAHGDSAKPHDAAAYPPDALMRDGLALIAHLGLTDYDLGGYSLGARTTCADAGQRRRAAPGRVFRHGPRPASSVPMGAAGISATS